MKTRAALLAPAALSVAMLLPATAWAGSDDKDKDDKPKVKTIRVVSVSDTHGFLGVGVADVDEDRAQELGLRDDYGVEVKSVVSGSPASKAGVKKGDVVLEYNGSKVESTAQFIRMVRETRVGRQIKMQVFRDGHTVSLSGSMEKRQPRVMKWRSKSGDLDDLYDLETPEPPETPDADDDINIVIPDIDIQIPDIPSPLLSWNTPRLGVETEALGQQLAEYFGVKDGVLVRAVIKNSAAEKAGIKAGDVIVKIGSEEISRPGDISSVLRSAESSELPVFVVRKGREVTLTAKIDRSKGPRRRSGLYWTPAPQADSDSDSDSDRDTGDEDDEDGDDL